MARAALREDLYAAHASLIEDVLGAGRLGELPRDPEERLAAWVARNEAAVGIAQQTLGEIWESERFTFATCSVALPSHPHPSIRQLPAELTLNTRGRSWGRRQRR